MSLCKTCILIDDDIDDQEIFLAAVHDVDASVDARVNGDAVKTLSSLKDSMQLPDVIFLDINMPLMNGFEFMSLIQEDARLKQIPVVFYCTTSKPLHIQNAYALGARGFLTKPTSYTALCDRLKQYLQAQTT